MRIIKGRPPNYEKIAKAFHFHEDQVVFTYGDAIYNPGGKDLPWHIIAHEEVHTKQQGEKPDDWWERYLADPPFRVSQELEAYRGQYQSFCGQVNDRNKRSRFAYKIAADLSGEVYGNGNCISFNKAFREIKK